jgi:hypothetical protein
MRSPPLSTLLKTATVAVNQPTSLVAALVRPNDSCLTLPAAFVAISAGSSESHMGKRLVEVAGHDAAHRLGERQSRPVIDRREPSPRARRARTLREVLDVDCPVS